jgi:TRAP-type C4-dicarboxylate transport system substrate-binding protein
MFIALASTAVLVLAACSSNKNANSPDASKVYTVRASILQAPGTQEYNYFKAFADAATSLSNHRLVFQLFPNSQLGTQAESIGQLQSNTVQFVDDTYTAADTLVADTDLMTLPGVWTSGTQFTDAWNGGALGQLVGNELKAKGLVALGAAYLGNQDIATNKPINSVADLSGLKIRVLTGPYLAAACKALGMTSVNVNVNDIVTSVGTGLINSLAQATSTLWSSKRYQLFKYDTQATFYPANIGIMGSAKFFDTLPADLQQDLIKAGYQASNNLSAQSDQATQAAVTSLRGAGLTVTTMPSDQQALMTQMITGPVQDLWKQKNGDTALNLALSQK